MLDKESILKALHLLKDYEAIIVENNQLIASLSNQVAQFQDEKRRTQTYISGLEHELKALQPAHDLLNDPELIQLMGDMNLSNQPVSGQYELPANENPANENPANENPANENPANEPLSFKGLTAELKKIGQEIKTNWEHHKS